jgi:hypothetical protein
MKLFLYLSVIGFLLICEGCGRRENKDSHESVVTINIDTNKATKIDISEFVDSVQFIKLQTTNDNLIRGINNLFFFNNQIVVVDKKEHQVLIFNDEGIFKNSIKKRGRGPGEYVSMSTVLFDPKEGNIIVYDARSFKMLFFSMEGGLIREISNFCKNTLVRDIINLPDGNFLCYTYDYTEKKVGHKASGLWEVDSLGNYIQSFFCYETLYPAIFNYSNSYFTRLSENVVGLRDALTNEVYYIEKGKLHTHISYKISNYDRNKYAGDTYTEKKFTTSLTHQDKENYIFTEWTDLDNIFYTIHSKKDFDKTNLIYPAKNLFSDRKVIEPLNFGFIDSNNYNALITILSGTSLLDFIKDNQASDEIKDKIQNIIADMSKDEIEDMNPVLQLLYIKK